MKIGYKIREKRIQLGLTQEELANRCELTKGYISQLENDKTDPSIQTLKLILDVLGMSLGEFFKEDKYDKVVYNEEEQLDKVYDSYIQSWLVPNAQNLEMEPIWQVINPYGKTELINPFEGEVFGCIIEGNIILHLGSEEFACKAGETFYFKANKEHFLENSDNNIAKVLLVASPPHF